MQQPLTYIFQTLFQHEVFVITPTLNAGLHCTSCYSWQPLSYTILLEDLLGMKKCRQKHGGFRPLLTPE